ncbi:MAG: acyl-CoA dehydrogenase family protein [Deltaproteobacteria bacterium]|nr:acyl-CoA dehydrogenase family protein [Deltaproteobacteria bacterium]MBW2385327.1 acyl-CoA dehydrogenase family protein [Deltaproteobacteria bacterium]
MKPEDVIPAARALLPATSERAEKTEAARHLLPEAVADLRTAGMFKLLQPKRWGGFELDPAALVMASAELARACGSTGWCLGVLAVHNWMLGLYEEQAQADVWAEDPETLLAASFAPTGRAECVADGIRVSGRWSFASGCDASSWMMVGAALPSEGPIPDLRLFLVPQSQYRIDDNWHVSGLAGTGSKDIVIDGALVPEHRSLSLVEAMAGHSPGRELYADSPLYRVPFGSMLLFALVGPALGLARGTYAAFLERARTRQITYSVEKQSEQTPVHVMLGDVSYQLDAVELLWERDLAEIARVTREKQDFTLEQRARYKRDVGVGLRSCQEVVAKLSGASGAHGIFLSSSIQRAFRDTHAMTTHAALDPTQAARTMGRVALELDPATAIL